MTNEEAASLAPYTHESRKIDRIIATNEWMRRYTEEPEKYEREIRTVQRFLEEDASGKEPSYGEVCEAYLEGLMEELSQLDSREESRRRKELEERIAGASQ